MRRYEVRMPLAGRTAQAAIERAAMAATPSYTRRRAQQAEAILQRDGTRWEVRDGMHVVTLVLNIGEAAALREEFDEVWCKYIPGAQEPGMDAPHTGAPSIPHFGTTYCRGVKR